MWPRVLIYCALILPVLCRLDDDTAYQVSNCAIGQCFHQPREECPSPESTCRCRQLTHCRRMAVCCDVTEFQLSEGLACGNITGHIEVEALHIRNATLDVLNVTRSIWRGLRFMTITQGRINNVIGEFGKHSTVGCLNLSSNSIHKFEDRSLVNLFNLSYLDLSHNNLSDVPRFKKEGNITLDISDNKNMLCSSLISVLKNNGINFNNANKTFCLSSKNFHWFNSTENVQLSQVISVHKFEKDCVKNCTCKVDRLQLEIGNPPTFTVAVNCSAQKYWSLPTPLPQNTVSLDVSNNNITSLKELSDPSYEHLRFLLADNNQITSIQPLEGTKFMSNFVTLSLKNNKIKSLETYLLSNIKFDRNINNPRHISLGQNNLHCDCNTAKDLKVWLLTKQNHVSDYNEITCKNIVNKKVVELNPTKLCQSQQDWTDYIFYIIAAEVLLLVGLIAKVFYDYWIFKTAGYLPWPASKMPKLPCDWLCE